VVVFSEAVDPTSLNFSITPTPPRLNLTWSDNGTILTITHGELEEGTNYTFRVIYYRDLAGNVGRGAVSAFRSAEAAAEEKGVVGGRVVNENGMPIGGARVEADTGEWTVTDENGNFTLELTPGHRTINIIVNGTIIKTIEVDVEAGGRRTRVRLRFPRRVVAVVEGREEKVGRKRRSSRGSTCFWQLLFWLLLF